jgi:O-antigen/teichoic acid export membrane protein
MQLYKSIYVRQVATLLTGNGIAQLLSLAAAPFLTRLYGPEAFGALALFVALIAALTPGVCGRYEMAIVVAGNEHDRLAFFFISIWFAVGVSFLMLLILAVAFLPVSNLLQAGVLGNWLWITPAALLVTGVITALRAYGNAVKDYRALSNSAITQTTTNGLLAILLGYTFGLADGQLYAAVGALVVTGICLLFVYRKVFSTSYWRWDRSKWLLALQHKDYPVFNAPTNILNGIMTGLPVFFLAKHYSAEVVGYYALLVRVGVSPLSFISDAVSRVNLKKTSELLAQGEDPIPHLKRITTALLLIAALPSVALMATAPALFSWAFGENWREAGALLVILMPALAVQFVVSTLSLSFVAAGRLRLQAIWQVFSFAVTISVFSWAAGWDVNRFFLAFMLKDVGLYLLYYVMIFYALKNPIDARGRA